MMSGAEASSQMNMDLDSIANSTPSRHKRPRHQSNSNNSSDSPNSYVHNPNLPSSSRQKGSKTTADATSYRRLAFPPPPSFFPLPSSSSSSSSLRPFSILFPSHPAISTYKLTKELASFWKNGSNIDTSCLNITSRFGFNGSFLIIPRDAFTFDTLFSLPWPEKLDNQTIEAKKPSRPPAHHSIVIHDIPTDCGFDDVREELDEKYGQDLVLNIARIYRRNGEPLPSIRVDFSSPRPVLSLLENGFIHLLYGRHKY